MMPASAVQTKTWFRPKGWFTDREVAIVVNRVLRDDPSKGDMHNRQAITPRRLWASLAGDYDLWPLYLLGLLVYIPQSPPTKYITLILRSTGFGTFDTNLLTIPSVSSKFGIKHKYLVNESISRGASAHAQRRAILSICRV